MYLFAFIVVIVAVMMEWGLGTGQLITGWSADAIDTIIGSNDPSQSIETNPTFIYGDFTSVAKAWVTLIYGTVSGGLVYDVFANMPFVNEYVMLFIRGIYTFCTFSGVLTFLSGRI